jgi:hypothetical protein
MMNDNEGARDMNTMTRPIRLHGHTPMDSLRLAHPERTQPRDHAVPCQMCPAGSAKTWNVDALCDRHYDAWATSTTTAEVDHLAGVTTEEVPAEVWAAVATALADRVISPETARHTVRSAAVIAKAVAS